MAGKDPGGNGHSKHGRVRVWIPIALLGTIAAAYGLVRGPVPGPAAGMDAPRAAPALDLKGDRLLVPGPEGPRPIVLPAGSGAAVRCRPRPRGFATAALDGSEESLLAVSDFMGSRVLVFTINPDGSPEWLSDLAVPAGPRGLLAADFDADGRADLAVASAVAQTVSVFLGDGAGGFNAVAAWPIDGIPVSLSRVQPDGPEGEADIAAVDVRLAEGVVLRYRSLGGGTFEETPEPMAQGAELVAAFATPAVDFEALRTCARSLTMPPKKISAAVKKVNAAEKRFAAASAGTKVRKFAKSAKQLVGYINLINAQVDRSIDATSAAACTVPAQADLDAILLIGVPAQVAIEGGDGQTARPFDPLPQDLAVHVEDPYGNRAFQTPVAFRVVSGDGSLSKPNGTTGPSGVASTALIFGGPPDEDVIVEASATAPQPPIPLATFTEHKVTGTISLAGDVQPILGARCATSGCHDAQTAEEGMNLSAGNIFHPASGIVSVPSHQVPALMRVAPFDAGNSYLIHKIKGTQGGVGGDGDRMPVGGVLPPSSIFLIEAWVGQGAQDN